MKSVTRIYFNYEEDKLKPHFVKSMKEILFLNGELAKASMDYIPIEEEEAFEYSLKASNPKQYCLYTVYKIVHFLEIISKIRVRKLRADFVRDVLGNFWLIDISHLDYQEIKNKKTSRKVVASEEEVPEIDPERLRELDNKLEANPKLKAKITNVREMIKDHFEKTRIKFGLHDRGLERKFRDEIWSEQAFSHFHPETSFTLKEILNGEVNQQKLRKFIQSNFNPKNEAGPYSIKNVQSGRNLYWKSPTSKQSARSTKASPESRSNNARESQDVSTTRRLVSDSPKFKMNQIHSPNNSTLSPPSTAKGQIVLYQKRSRPSTIDTTVQFRSSNASMLTSPTNGFLTRKNSDIMDSFPKPPSRNRVSLTNLLSPKNRRDSDISVKPIE